VAELKTAHLVLMGFSEEMIARNVLFLVKEAADAKTFKLLDWALAVKDHDGKVKLDGDKGTDPGAARGGMFGGALGMLLVAAGPVGLGAVAVGAGVGAVAAAMRDSGMQDKDLKSVGEIMKPGRSGLVVAIEPGDLDAWTDFVAHNVEFHAAQPVVHVDITPDHTFEQAIAEYKAAHAG
jgi:uncharacterized membrane protein